MNSLSAWVISFIVVYIIGAIQGVLLYKDCGCKKEFNNAYFISTGIISFFMTPLFIR